MFQVVRSIEERERRLRPRPKKPQQRPPVPVFKKHRKKYPKGYYGTRDLAKMMDARVITLGRVLRSCWELLLSQSAAAARLLLRIEKLLTKFERLQMAKEDSR